MNYTCLLWSNSGFNSVNIPDGPDLLMNMSYLSLPVLDLNQERFLPSVRVRATWDQVKDADYCKVGDFFYTVDKVFMSSGDVAELFLTPDFVTSAGGPGALQFLDGVTERVHVTNDAYGLYTADDPYMAPAYTMKLLSDVATGDFYSVNGGYTFIETTIDLLILGAYKQGGTVQPAITAIDENDEEHYITYPTVEYIGGSMDTDYYINLGGSDISVQTTKGQILVYMDSNASGYNKVRDGIAVARALGVEESISGSYQIPYALIEPPRTLSENGVEVLGLSGKGGLKTCSIPYIYGEAQNNRVFYGSQTPFTLCSAAGSTMSAPAEDIYESGQSAPRIRYTADPRREGKPYFRFNRLQNSGNSVKPKDFFRGCIAGMPWRSVPMVFTDKSGSLLDQSRFNASVTMSELQYEQAYTKNVVQNSLEMANTAKDTAQNMFDFKFGSAMMASANHGEAEAMRNLEFDQYKQRLLQQRANDTMEFQISQNVNVPTVNFAVNPQLFSEIIGNGFGVYRVVYDARDIARIDRILTAFGYRYTKTLDSGDFTNRLYFNYVKASVSVTGLPRWFAEGVATQLGNGVRVWHVVPDKFHYNYNPVR